MNYNKSLLESELGRLELSAGEEQKELLDKFALLLIEKNKVMNLTAITDPDGTAVKHFADSLSILKAHKFSKGEKVLDLGTGAGFPGVPLLTAEKEIDLYLMDSTAKKLAFIDEALAELGLKATTVHSRAEEAGRKPEYRETFDVVCSRAVAALNVLCEYCLPFVKQGGVFIAMKGANAKEEVKAAYTAIKTLGGKIIDEIDFELSDGARSIIVIEKENPTPAKYPRESGVIKKKPL